MRTAVIGAEGQLGRALIARFDPAEVIPLTHRQIEITDASSIAAALDGSGADLVVNAAAYNFVDRAEDEPAAAFAVNASGPRRLAEWCAARGAALVHVSTDHVFGLDAARSTPYAESDCPGPLSVYGASKLAGEYLVRSACARHFVIRTCGLYGVPPPGGKGNFVETMLRLGRERGEVRVVCDQRCTPTSAGDLARLVIDLCRTRAYGLYHATNSGSATWHEFATEIFRLAGLSVRVHPITTAEFQARARRPAYSVLDCTRLEQQTGAPRRDWRTALAEYLAGRS